MALEERKAVYQIDGQVVSYLKKESFTGPFLTDSMGVYTFEFRFSQEWKDFSKITLFVKCAAGDSLAINITDPANGKAEASDTGVNYKVLVPAQMLFTPGKLTVGFTGYKKDDVEFRFPTNTDSSYTVTQAVPQEYYDKYPQSLTILEEILLKIDDIGQGTGAGITVDSALSATSTNPIQNKVVSAEFAKLPDTYANKNEIGTVTDEQVETAVTNYMDSNGLKEKINGLFAVTEPVGTIQYYSTGQTITTKETTLEADGYYHSVITLSESGSHCADYTLGITRDAFSHISVEAINNNTGGKLFVGVGSAYNWKMMTKVEIDKGSTKTVTLYESDIPGDITGNSMLHLYLGSSYGQVGSNFKFKFTAFRKTDNVSVASYADGLTVAGLEKAMPKISAQVEAQVPSIIEDIPIGMNYPAFAQYSIRESKGASTLTQLNKGWVNFKKTGNSADTKYQGVYVKIPYTSLDDLDGEWTIEVDPVLPYHPEQLWILYEISDWGSDSTGRIGGIRPNTIFNLKDMLNTADRNYASKTYCYICVCKFAPSGVTDPADFNIRIKFVPNNSQEVLATDVTQSLREKLISSIQENATYITCWGDSLTAMGGWTDTLKKLSGLNVYNGGTGGENAKTILARQGGDVMIVNNITIPADTTAVTIATKADDGGISTFLGNTVTPCLQSCSHVNPAYIGDVEGTLAWTGSSYSDTTGTWTFTRSKAGEEVVINRPTAIRTNYDINKNAPKVMIIFMGQNGGYDDDNNKLIQMHKYMIDHAHAQDYLILGLSSGTAEGRAPYETAMKKEFGRRFLSLREYLSQYGLNDLGLTPTEEDTAAMAVGKVPPSLLIDSVHFTADCRTLIGKLIYKTLKELNILK